MDIDTDQAQIPADVSFLQWVNLFHSQHYALETSLSPQECSDRLQAQASMHYSRDWFYVCTHPLVGWAAADGFNISRCVPYKNAYRTWAKGKLVRSGPLTVVSCRTAVHHATAAGALLILAAWIAVLSFFPIPILEAVFVLWLGTVLVRLYLARRDRAFLFQLLKTTLDAHQTPTPTLLPDGRVPVDARQLYRTLPGHHVPTWTRLIQAVFIVVIIAKLALIGLALWKSG